MGPWHSRWIVLALLVSLTSSVPTWPSYKRDASIVEINKDVTDICLKEGDVVCKPGPDPHLLKYSIVSFDCQTLFVTAQRFRMGPMDKYRLWIRRIVPYVMDPSLGPNYKEAIVKSMKDIEEISCLKFKEKEPEDEDFIAIRQLRGCYSYVGRTGREQTVSLARNCFTPARGIILHELLHVLGAMHEHTRPDRDDYITIVEDNIEPAQLYNFEKRPPHLVDTLGLGYDYSSLMHYGMYDFALDRSEPTIIPHSPDAVIGQREFISKLDAEKLNALYKCDIKECPDPGTPEAGFRIGDDFSVGAVVTFLCEDGHTLLGYNQSFCRFDGEWTGFQPRCIANEVVDTCNFESGMCGWANDDENAELSWERKQGSKQRLHTGPVLDHTLQISKGFYLLLDSNFPRLPEQKGRVITPTFRPQGDQVCLRLAYYMWGEDMGTLNIYMRFHNRVDVLVWSAQGNKGPSWKVLSLAFAVSKPFQIVIEGIIGYEFSDMAIDDYSLEDCVGNEPLKITVPDVSEVEPVPLPVEFGCTFEEELCDFVNADDADFHWLMAKGPTTTFRSGPSVDHTLGTEDGHYIYTEASFPRKPGDTAKIIFPVIEDPSVPHCLRFYYHMYGDTMGTLKVHVLHGNPETLSPMWVAQGNRGDLWRKVQLTIPETTGNLQIAFEGIIGDGVRSDIALDDIFLMIGSCPE